MISRRRFVTGALTSGVIVGGGAGIRLAFRDRAAAVSATQPTPHTLVFVFLRGGPDGCSVLVPGDDASYGDARAGIAVPTDELLPIDDVFGLHPAMAPVFEHVTDGRVAFVPACGSVLDSRSHFTQQAMIEQGGEDASGGWLARAMSADGSAALPVVAVGTATPRSLAGSSTAIAFDDLDRVGLPAFGRLQPDDVEPALRSLAGLGGPLVDGATQAALDTLPILTSIVGAGDEHAAPNTRAAGRRPSLGDRLSDVAQVIRADVGLEFATVDAGGWDTHDSMGTTEGGLMTDRIEDLASGLARFAEELGPALGTTTVVAMGEFGRRVAENGSGGTDHGRGGVLLAMGGPVTGGRYGEWRGLSSDALDHGDVPVLTDWRTVVSEILVGLHGRSVDVVFPGFAADPLGIVGRETGATGG